MAFYWEEHIGRMRNCWWTDLSDNLFPLTCGRWVTAHLCPNITPSSLPLGLVPCCWLSAINTWQMQCKSTAKWNCKSCGPGGLTTASKATEKKNPGGGPPSTDLYWQLTSEQEKINKKDRFLQKRAVRIAKHCEALEEIGEALEYLC